MPYGSPQSYYGMPPQYSNGAGVPAQAYNMPYQNYSRSPPAAHSYVHPMAVNGPPSYPPRQHLQSPALSNPYHPPSVAQGSLPPHTPSSTHSSQTAPPQTPPTPQTVAPPSVQESPAALIPEKKPFRAPLPWLSRPDVEFPKRPSKLRTRRRRLLSGDVSLPVEQQGATSDPSQPTTAASAAQPQTAPAQAKQDESPSSETPAAADTVQPAPTGTASSAAAVKPTSRSAAVPAVPALPKSLPKATPSDGAAPEGAGDVSTAAKTPEEVQDSDAPPATDAQEETKPAARVPPSSWANLFTKKAGTPAVEPAESPSDKPVANGQGSHPVSQLPPKSNATNMAEAIRAYQVGSLDNISFIEPRGLINTGNMCYMNSILQVLMFCVPFYEFLKQVGSKAAHSFKSDTPLIDAMIMFTQEFTVSKSASSVNQLRQLLKPEDLEKFGEPFIPEFVYEAIRQLPRFASMRRGHQQDAEEFLGFLLQSLDDECTHVAGDSAMNPPTAAGDDNVVGDDQDDPSGDWLEVGRKQKAAVTRSSGTIVSTPITKIFGGLLRSEFRVPGLKDSITTEPYQPLQLDIGSPDVRNVVDALRGLTRPERLHGDFNSPRGKDVAATKQVFIETLPPVLILHLKRFQFDAHGTIKIWKKVDYPLELEIPREALSRQMRQSISDSSMPKYKLLSVVYHHGKNATAGHYTVDIRRQDGQEWLHMDDTVLRRIGSDDVAETGSEEEAKSLQKESVPIGASGNRFGAMEEEDTGDEDGWKQVTTTAGSNKRWSNVANGTGSTKAKQHKENVKDNKVAYLLFYQRV